MTFVFIMINTVQICQKWIFVEISSRFCREQVSKPSICEKIRFLRKPQQTARKTSAVQGKSRNYLCKSKLSDIVHNLLQPKMRDRIMSMSKFILPNLCILTSAVQIIFANLKYNLIFCNQKRETISALIFLGL